MKSNQAEKKHNTHPFLNPLCIALDVDSDERAMRLADELKGIAGGFKVGPRLILRYGPQIITELSKKAPVFVDCKFFDITSTMISSVQAAFDSGASLVTVHALSGKESLLELSKLESNLNKIRPFKILCVTVLTSWDEKNFPSVFKKQTVQDHVVDLVESVRESGLLGVVCSSHELKAIRNNLANKNLYLVTPGIRFSTDSKGDQKRITEPNEALDFGANIIVVGRPIIESSNPKDIATAYLKAVTR